MTDAARASVNLDVSSGRDLAPAAPRPEDPFRIAIIGNFRGRTGAGADALADRTGVLVDRDDLDEVLARLAPRLTLELEGGTEVALSFAELDDFHPDKIFQRAPFFRALREARSRLANPQTFSATLDSIIGGARAPARPGGPRVDADDVVADVLTSSLLDRMVASGAEAARDPLQGFLRQIVAPHIVPGEDPHREALLADVDTAVADGMRAVLHHPRFQALEALWRGVDFLVRRLETGAMLKLQLIDATTDELRADLTGSGDPDNGALARVLRRTAQGGGWSTLLLEHAFGPSEDDLVLLYGLSALAARLGAAVLGGAQPAMVALDSFAALMPEADAVHEWQHEAWHAFRRRTEAASAGLVLPRFLLRVPYGENGEPCDVLRFEEMTTPPTHDDFLWGNGAFAAALLLGQAFDHSGWEMRPGQQIDVTGLPLHTWRSTSGPEIQPCAECLMTDRLANALMDAGPMVLATIKHGDTARLVRFHSLAAPLRALQGPWSRL